MAYKKTDTKKPKFTFPLFKTKPPEVSRYSNRYRPHFAAKKASVKQVFNKKTKPEQTARHSASDKSRSTKKPFTFKKYNLDGIRAKIAFLLLRTKISLRRFDFFSRFSIIATTAIALMSLSALIYISFFDTKFIIKNYQITFSSNSYIDYSTLEALDKKIQNSRILGIFPLNSYWFINDKSLYNSAKQISSEIENIKIIDKTWPNKISIDIASRDVLATLAVNIDGHTQFWLISKEGKILGQDDLNLRQNLIYINSPISFTAADHTFQDINMSEHELQLQKIWFANDLQSWARELGIKIDKVALSSFSDLDSDVYLVSSEGTLLIFDYNSLGQNLQKDRLTALLKSTTLRQDMTAGKIKYIDMRFNKQVFYCYKVDACASLFNNY